MKKLLLFAIIAMAAMGSAKAQEPKVYPGEAFVGFSPDGNYTVSVLDEYLAIFNLATDKKAEYTDGYYYIGNGNAISNTGIVVGSTMTPSACYWKDGEWHDFPSVANRNMSKADGVTPNGNRIVGAMAPESYEGGYEGLMLTPCYWDMQADGTPSEAHALPFPVKDLTGRTPQYITAIRVSDDGKVIAGQVVDYSGTIIQPIVYRQDEEGAWSYTLIHNDLFHPEGIVLPEDPGDNEPTIEDFMTAEEFAAYNKALEDWNEAGTWDYETYPNYWDFMTAEELAAYETASNEYNDKWNAFFEAFDQLYQAVPTFEFNNVFLSGDGKHYGCTYAKGGFDFETWSFIQDNVPYVFNLENDTYITYPDAELNLILSSMTNDGTLLAQKPATEINPATEAYILPAGAEKFISLYDYFVSANPTLAKWIKENMTHEYEAYDMETWELYTAEALATGIPFANADMSIIATTVTNFWYDWSSEDTSDYVPAYSYLLYPGYNNGDAIVSTKGSNASVKVTNGKLLFTGDVTSATVYDMNGAKVYSVNAPSSVVNTGLKSGVYVVKAVAADGTVKVVKAAF